MVLFERIISTFSSNELGTFNSYPNEALYMVASYLLGIVVWVQLTDESNRYFFYERNNQNRLQSGHNEGEVLKFTKNISGPMNQAILDNEGELETHFKVNRSGRLRYHFHTGDVQYELVDGDDGGDFEDAGVSEPKPIGETFPGSEGASAIVGDNLGYGRVRYIIGDRVIRAKGDSKDGTDQDQAINDNSIAYYVSYSPIT
jgi:hypothetical protein